MRSCTADKLTSTLSTQPWLVLAVAILLEAGLSKGQFQALKNRHRTRTQRMVPSKLLTELNSSLNAYEAAIFRFGH